MAVHIRLKRMGRRHKAAFRLAAMDHRDSRDSKVIEELGSYDPLCSNPERAVQLRRERIEYWLGVGAQPSETVRALLKRHGIGSS